MTAAQTSQTPNRRQLGFLIDTHRCIGCGTCAMACKNQHQQPSNVLWRRLYDLKAALHPFRNRVFFSLACNHCEHPACLAACPVKAYHKRESDGIVVHTQEKCIGCGNCIRACPWGAPQYNPELKQAEKCSLCWQRLDAGLEPACVLACPVRALQVIEIGADEPDGSLPWPPGFPAIRTLNPSVRFRTATLPVVIKDDGLVKKYQYSPLPRRERVGRG